jgi:hypothetical protein
VCGGGGAEGAVRGREGADGGGEAEGGGGEDEAAAGGQGGVLIAESARPVRVLACAVYMLCVRDKEGIGEDGAEVRVREPGGERRRGATEERRRRSFSPRSANRPGTDMVSSVSLLMVSYAINI